MDATNLSWQQRIRNAFATLANHNIKPRFFPAAGQVAIERAQSRISQKFPHDLCALLMETNGFGETLILGDGRRPIHLGKDVFSVEEIVKFTNEFRALRLQANMDVNELCFFGTPHVDGIYFVARRDDETVFEWDPFDTRFKPIAPCFADLVVGWCSGKLPI